jgi:hypothetical protein
MEYKVRRRCPSLVLAAALLAAQARLLFAASMASSPEGVSQWASAAGPAASVPHSFMPALASGPTSIGQLKATLSPIAGAPSVFVSAPGLAAPASQAAAPQAAALPQLVMPAAPIASVLTPDEPAADSAPEDAAPASAVSLEAQPNAASAAELQAPALAGGLLGRLSKAGDSQAQMWDGSAKKGSEADPQADSTPRLVDPKRTAAPSGLRQSPAAAAGDGNPVAAWPSASAAPAAQAKTDETGADLERTQTSVGASAGGKAQRTGNRGHRHQKLKMPTVEGHPNRLPFEGTLSLIDTPSDKTPGGARGHRVSLTMQAARAALPSLLGMAIDYRPEWDGHDAQRKIGLLTEAQIIGKRLVVRGFLYARDFPEAVKTIKDLPSEEMGMSYEVADAKVEDMRADVWKLTRVTFTGAAVLLREKAAYTSTAFRLAEPAAAPGGEQAKPAPAGP